MKVAIVGVGAVGGLFAAWLSRPAPAARIELCALARGATLAALRRDGLQLIGADELTPTAIALRASDDPAELGPQELVIVAVKAPALAQAAPAVAALCGAHTQVLAAMNGVPWWFFDGLPGPGAGWSLDSVDPGGAIARRIPAHRVVGCVVHASSSAPTPGAVRHAMGNGLVIGRPHGGSDAALTELAGLLSGAGFAVTVSERIQREVWFKLWGNLTMNPISALTGAASDRVLDDPLVRAFTSAVMHEAQAVGAALGIPIEQTPEARHAITRKLGSFRTSMLQDAQAGKPLELDALVGAVREIGTRLGLATPNIDALFGLTRLMARERGLYPAAG